MEQGFQFALQSLVVQYLGNSRSAAAPGDFVWSLTVNQPIGIGSFQGSVVQGFSLVDVGLGAVQRQHVNGRLLVPWPLECPEIFQPNDSIRSVFINVNFVPGAPNFLVQIYLTKYANRRSINYGRRIQNSPRSNHLLRQC